MKLEDFKIQFENERGVFCVGEEVHGTVCISLKQPMKMRTLKITFEGKGKSHWEVKQGRSKTDYRANESYINYTLILFGSANTTSEHPSGYHSYPFALRLAPNLPSSFEGRRGYVRYFCKATIDRPWKFDENTKRAFTVIRHLDLNTLQESGYPIFAEQDKTIEGCCCSSGTVSAQFMLNKKGFVPGEPMAYTIDVTNSCDNNTDGIRLDLKQDVTYTGYSSSIFSSGNPKLHVKSDSFPLLNILSKIRPHKSEHISQTVVIPALPPSKLDGCGIIDIKYSIVLTVPVGWTNIEMEREIIIGTIPLQIPSIVPSYPAAVSSPEASASAPPMEPPTYIDAPPAYEDCVFGGANIRDENDDEHTLGHTQWTPAYPYYHWGDTGPPPVVPSAPPPAYSETYEKNP